MTSLQGIRSILLMGILTAQVACGAIVVPDDVPRQHRNRYRALQEAIEWRRSLDLHCWCRAYRGGLCGRRIAAKLHLSAEDVPLLERLGESEDYQVAAGAVEML